MPPAASTHDHRYEVYPQFTPDGRILYVRLNESWTDHDVVLMDGDGRTSGGPPGSDCFDYRGRTFGYPLVSPGTLVPVPAGSVRLVQRLGAVVDGSGEPRQVAPAEADQSDAAWSPTARASPTSRTNGTLDLRVVDATACCHEPRALVAPELGVCQAPSWSPTAGD